LRDYETSMEETNRNLRTLENLEKGLELLNICGVEQIHFEKNMENSKLIQATENFNRVVSLLVLTLSLN
jgi:hypothetical protein